VSVFRSRLGVAIAIIDDQILAEFPVTELHLHRSDRIFGGEGDRYLHGVSRRVPRGGPPLATMTSP
jgi:hypothetical protein